MTKNCQDVSSPVLSLFSKIQPNWLIGHKIGACYWPAMSARYIGPRLVLPKYFARDRSFVERKVLPEPQNRQFLPILTSSMSKFGWQRIDAV